MKWITNNQKRYKMLESDYTAYPSQDYLCEATEISKKPTQEEVTNALNGLIKRSFDYCKKMNLKTVDSFVYVEDMPEKDIIYFKFAVKEDGRVPEYTEKELISFGNYLLTEDRKKLFQHMEGYPMSIILEERLKKVSDADLCNWKEKEGI